MSDKEHNCQKQKTLQSYVLFLIILEDILVLTDSNVYLNV